MKNQPTDKPSASKPDPKAFRPLGPAGAAPLLEKARASARTGVLEVEGDGGMTAAVMVRSGRVVEATSGPVRGREAVLRIFMWTGARYRWTDEPVAEAAPPDLETAALVTEGLRRRAVWQLMLRELPPLSARYAVDFARLASRLDELPTVARDLCRLFDGRRSLAEVFTDASMPELEAASIVGHLLAAGIVTPVDPPELSIARVHAAPARPNLPATPGPGPLVDPLPARADNEEIVGALERAEQTDLVVLPPPAAAPRPPGVLRLAAFGGALGIGAALMFSLGRGPAPQANVQTSAPQENIRSVSVRPAAPVPTPAVLSAPPAPRPTPVATRDRELCLRGQDQEVSAKVAAACERNLSKDGLSAPVLGVLARGALEQGRFGRAGELARQALALDPKLAEAYAYLGFAEAEAGRRAAALAAYRQYLALAPQGRLAPDIRAIIAR